MTSESPTREIVEGEPRDGAAPLLSDATSSPEQPHRPTPSGKGEGAAQSGGRAFAGLWSATATSNLGDGVMIAAAPLAAASLTSDPRLVAGVTVAATLPWALFCLVSGAVVDRVDRIRLMWRIDLVRALVIAVPAVWFAVGSPSIHVLFVVFFCLGTAETFYANAAQAALPLVVPSSGLRSANGKLQSAELVLNQLVGPPLGGLLFAVAVALPFALNSASLLLSATLLFLVRRGQKSVPARRPAGRNRLGREIGEGLSWLWRDRHLRMLAVFTGLVNLLTEATMSILVLFSREDLGLGTVGFGHLLAMAAVGGVVASAVGPQLSARLGDRRTLIAVLAVQSGSQLVIFMSSSFALVAAALACAAGGIVMWNIVTISLRQTVVPDHLLGRVNSVYRFVAWGTIPLGAGAGGVVAAIIGIRSLFLASGLLLAGVCVLAVFVLHAPTREAAPSP